jgi:hypothetical protein
MTRLEKQREDQTEVRSEGWSETMEPNREAGPEHIGEVVPELGRSLL